MSKTDRVIIASCESVAKSVEELKKTYEAQNEVIKKLLEENKRLLELISEKIK